MAGVNVRVLAGLSFCGLLAPLGGCEASSPSRSNVAASAPFPPPATARDVLKLLADAKLPVSSAKDVTAAGDDNRLLGRPHQYTSKLFFYDARHPKAADGSDDGENTIEVFDNSADAKARHDYIEGITKNIPMLAQYQLIRGKILVRLDKAIIPVEAEQYKKAIDKMTAASSGPASDE